MAREGRLTVVVARIHHGSHRRLLADSIPRAATARKVDAIVVPTARTSPYLRHAISLADEFACTLVVLCSRYATSAVAEFEAAASPTVDFVAIDLPATLDPPIPHLRTSEMLAGTRFERPTDTSAKRNVGLMLAGMLGWNSVVFLDDDIVVPDPADLRRAVALLTDYDCVGLDIGGFPDNSVVCHAHRECGGLQDTFVGGGALAVSGDRLTSFFPNIYNEDWFFLLDDARLRPVTVTGRAVQWPYDPFADPDRARAEEFGDTLAEGVYWLLDCGRRVQDADEPFWRDFLNRRGALIQQILRRLSRADGDPVRTERMVESLKAAYGRLKLVTPALCVDYLRAWRADRTRWKRAMAELPTSVDIGVALKTLGLKSRSRVCTR